MTAAFDLESLPFLTALHQAVACALDTYPAEQACIKRATQLLLSGEVSLESGTAYVSSGMPTGVHTHVIPGQVYRCTDHVYVITGKVCPCPDAPLSPGGRCAHVFARHLAVKALQLMDHGEERRDAQAAKADLAALVCDATWRMRNMGQHEKTAGR